MSVTSARPWGHSRPGRRDPNVIPRRRSLRYKLSRAPSPANVQVIHHVDCQPPVRVTSHAAIAGPATLPALNSCCISPMAAGGEPAGGARSTAMRNRVAGIAAPENENAATQTTCRMSPPGSTAQFTANASSEVTAMAAKAGISRARTGTPRSRTEAAPTEPAAPRPPTTAVRTPGQTPCSPLCWQMVGRNPTTVIHSMVKQAKASPAIQGLSERTAAPMRRAAAAAVLAPRRWSAGRMAATSGSGATVIAVMSHHSSRQGATCAIAALPIRPAKVAMPVEAPQ